MIRFALTLFLFLAATPASAQEGPAEFTATLLGHAQLPAQSFLPAPADAPVHFQMSGRFSAGPRQEQPYAIFDERTGLSRPFAGQPLQGFSGIRALGEDRFLVLTDNGFGNPRNSSDALLMFHELRVDWEAGRVIREKTTFLSDPNRVVRFAITNEATETRYLTGADFDPESIQPVGDRYWIGDEFGPWLIEVDATGVVQQALSTRIDGERIRSPDNFFVRAPNPGGALPDNVIVPRSGGFEGMALGADGTTLYPLLEKPLWDAEAGAAQTIDGVPVLTMLEFDTAENAWTDNFRYYPLEDARHAIGDFNFIGGTRALIIERDSGQGFAPWSDNPAAFKRVYLVDLERTDANGVLEKIAYIDLLTIADPGGIGRGSADGVFALPHVTIENVDLVAPGVIVVANDNNYPYSVGREEGRADDSEFILLDAADFLAAE